MNFSTLTTLAIYYVEILRVDHILASGTGLMGC